MCFLLMSLTKLNVLMVRSIKIYFILKLRDNSLSFIIADEGGNLQI